jgi:D-aminopeptidase
MTRLVAVSFALIVLLGATGVVVADGHDSGKACPEEGNPSEGLEQSVTSSEGESLHAVKGVNQAFESVGCKTRLP